MRRLAVAWLVLALAACARERAPVPPAPPPLPAYRTIALTVDGRIEGRMLGPDPETSGPTIVWLDDVRAGKPLPLERRFELDLWNVDFVPWAQAAIVGGMLNVRDLEDSAHRARFTLSGHDAAEDSLLAVVEESGEGQVVPTPRPLARTGLVLVTCDRHPSERAWIRVFDQPYFTVADSSGRFAFDSVPQGTWRLRAWSPVLGANDRHVIVDSTGTAFIELRLPP